MKGICVESGFRFYAVVSGCKALQKTMKNPLFRALNQEAAGIAQGRFLKVVFFSTIKTGENQKFILVSALMIAKAIRLLNKGGCFYE